MKAGRDGGMGGKAVRSVVVVLVALVLAALATFAAGGEARGLATDTVVSAQNERVADVVVEKSRSGTTAEKEAARGVLNEHAPKLKSFSKFALSRSNLAFTAGAVWYHNFRLMYYIGAGDQTRSKDLSAKFREHPDALKVVGHNNDGTLGSVTYLESFHWKYVGGYPDGRTSATAETTGEVANFVCTINGCFTRGGQFYVCMQYECLYWYLNGSNLTTGGKYLNIESFMDPAYRNSSNPPGPEHYSRADSWDDEGRPMQNGETAKLYKRDWKPGGTHEDTLVATFDRSSDATLSRRSYEMLEAQPSTNSPGTNDYASSPEDGTAFLNGVAEDPGVPEAWKKPWLSEGFRVPTDPLQREALWGPVVETYPITDEAGNPDPDGGGCKIYDYGTLICEWPDGYVYVNIDKDYTAWFEEPSGSKSPVTTREQRRQPEEYVADTGVFADKPTGNTLISDAQRRYIDARYFQNPSVTLYVPEAVVRELAQKPSASQDARLAGLAGPAKIVRVPDGEVPQALLDTANERKLGVNDMKIIEAAYKKSTMEGKAVPVLTTNPGMARQVVNHPQRRERWYPVPPFIVVSLK